MNDHAVLIGVISIVSILAGPILAVQAQVWLERRREARNRKLWVFKTLMTYRATPVNLNFVQALNLIDVEFNGANDKEKAVREAWKELLDHFSSFEGVANPAEKSIELTAVLLSVMGKCLGYDFDKVYMKKAAYYPKFAVNVEEEQHALRKQILEVLDGTGTRKIPVAVFEQRFPDLNDEPRD